MTDQVNWVVFQTFDNIFDANLAKSVLENNEITVFLEDNHMGSHTGTGGTRLFVAQEQAKKAAEILS